MAKKPTKSTKKTPAKKKPAANPEPEKKAEEPEAAPEPPAEDEPVPDHEPEPAPEPEPKAEAEPEPAPAPSTIAGPAGEFGIPSAEPVIKAPEPKIKIKNLRNRRVDITLEHAVYCAAIGRCVCSRREVIRERPLERKSRAMVHRKETILIPKSIILAPLGTSEPLHKAAEQCADVRSKVINRPQKLKILPA